ncbi:MAG: TPM domain-containing protein [Verrucomicrobiales bacterium]
MPACPGCGLSLAQLDEVYGASEVALERVNDSDGRLEADERSRLVAQLAAYESMFPQSFIVVHLGWFGSRTALRQFGFWLLNRGALVEGDAMRLNENGVVLMIDAEARLAGLTVGYQIEPWLPEAALEESLARGRTEFRDDRLGDGAVKVVTHLAAALRAALREPEAEIRKDWSRVNPLAGLRRLRSGILGRTSGTKSERWDE